MTDDDDAYMAAVQDYAGRALLAAMNDERGEAARLITELSDQWGPEAPVNACLAWADTYIARIGLPESVGAIAFVDADTGQVDVGGDAPAASRWAARWLLARRDMDEGAGRALIAELSTDAEWGGAVLALLSVVALRLRDGAPSISFGDALVQAATRGPGRATP